MIMNMNMNRNMNMNMKMNINMNMKTNKILKTIMRDCHYRRKV